MRNKARAEDHNAAWQWQELPDGWAADLVATDGSVLASCLVTEGETDTTSDGCGVFGDLRRDDIDWPDWSDRPDAA